MAGATCSQKRRRVDPGCWTSSSSFQICLATHPSSDMNVAHSLAMAHAPVCSQIPEKDKNVHVLERYASIRVDGSLVLFTLDDVSRIVHDMMLVCRMAYWLIDSVYRKPKLEYVQNAMRGYSVLSNVSLSSPFA
jgi:hypothetical protein